MQSLANQSGHDLTAMPSPARGEAGIHPVRRVVATPDALKGYGRLISDRATARVDLVPWPAPGRRPVVPGTGVGGGTVQGSFDMERRGGLLFAANHAVQRRYITGWYGDPASVSENSEPTDRTSILTHEANYHPDGGQIFFPRRVAPFVALLARAGDEVTPQDFVAFYCDGRAGIHIDPGVWHQPLFPVDDGLSFDDQQGAVHACISVDFLGEFGLYLKVPLR
jgi:hypothetical protein